MYLTAHDISVNTFISADANVLKSIPSEYSPPLFLLTYIGFEVIESVSFSSFNSSDETLFSFPEYVFRVE